MLKKLEAIKDRYDRLTELTADPTVLADMAKWKEYAKERADMEETVEKYKEYKKIDGERASAEELASVKGISRRDAEAVFARYHKQEETER